MGHPLKTHVGIELRQLEIFKAIAEERHFGNAARRLFMAQPSVSHALKRLEETLGVRLIDRTSRSVEVTPAGQVLLDNIDRINQTISDTIESVRAMDREYPAQIRIATNYPASRLLLLPLLRELREDYASPIVTLHEMWTPEQIKALQAGDIDLGLVFGPIESAGISSRHLLDIPVVAVVRSDHPLAASPTADLVEAGRYRWLTGYKDGGDVIWDAMRCVLPPGTVSEHPIEQVDPNVLTLEVETTDAVLFCSLTRGEQRRLDGLHMMRIGAPGPEPSVHVHVAWSTANFTDAIGEVVGRLVRLAHAIPPIPDLGRGSRRS